MPIDNPGAEPSQDKEAGFAGARAMQDLRGPDVAPPPPPSPTPELPRFYYPEEEEKTEQPVEVAPVDEAPVEKTVRSFATGTEVQVMRKDLSLEGGWKVTGTDEDGKYIVTNVDGTGEKHIAGGRLDSLQAPFVEGQVIQLDGRAYDVGGIDSQGKVYIAERGVDAEEARGLKITVEELQRRLAPPEPEKKKSFLPWRNK